MARKKGFKKLRHTSQVSEDGEPGTTTSEISAPVSEDESTSKSTKIEQGDEEVVEKVPSSVDPQSLREDVEVKEEDTREGDQNRLIEDDDDDKRLKRKRKRGFKPVPDDDSYINSSSQSQDDNPENPSNRSDVCVLQPGSSVRPTKNKSCWFRFRRSPRLVVCIVALAMCMDLMLMTAIEPILPDMVRVAVSGLTPKYFTPDVTYDNVTGRMRPLWHDSFNETIEVTAVFVTKPAVEVFSNIVFGYLIVQCGHHYPLLVGCVFSFLSTVGFAFANNIFAMFILRVFQALGSSLSTVAGLSLLHGTFHERESRAKNTALAFNGLTVGLLLGIPFGSLAYQFFGRAVPFLAIAVLISIDFMLRLAYKAPVTEKLRRRLLSRTDDDEADLDVDVSQEVSKDNFKNKTDDDVFVEEHEEIADDTSDLSSGSFNDRHDLRKFCVILSEPTLLAAFFLVFIQNLCFSGVLVVLPIFFQHHFDALQWEIGVVMGIGAIVQMVGQTIGGFGLVKIFPQWLIIWFGMLTYTAGLLVYPHVPSIWWVVLPESVCRFGIGMFLPQSLNIISTFGDIKGYAYGTLMGLYTASYNLGFLIGPLVAGPIYRQWGFIVMSAVFGAISFAFALLSFNFRNAPGEPYSDDEGSRSCSSASEPEVPKRISTRRRTTTYYIPVTVPGGRFGPFSFEAHEYNPKRKRNLTV